MQVEQGPGRFMTIRQVVSDPQILKHILREKVFNYDKGVPNSAIRGQLDADMDALVKPQGVG